MIIFCFSSQTKMQWYLISLKQGSSICGPGTGLWPLGYQATGMLVLPHRCQWPLFRMCWGASTAASNTRAVAACLRMHMGTSALFAHEHGHQDHHQHRRECTWPTCTCGPLAHERGCQYCYVQVPILCMRACSYPCSSLFLHQPKKIGELWSKRSCITLSVISGFKLDLHNHFPILIIIQYFHHNFKFC